MRFYWAKLQMRQIATIYTIADAKICIFELNIWVFVCLSCESTFTLNAIEYILVGNGYDMPQLTVMHEIIKHWRWLMQSVVKSSFEMWFINQNSEYKNLIQIG